MKPKCRWKFIVCGLLLPTLAISADPPGAGDAVVSGSDIERALAAAPRTRGIVLQATTERKELINLNIPFELNSSQLQEQAVAQLEQLESALKSSALSNSRFLVAGHTDGSGNAEYNRQLSRRRAESVKQFLVSHGVEAERLQTAGFGKDQLLTPDEPGNPLNRRVEIRNLGERP